MKTESKKLENGDLQVILTFDEHDQICLNHDLLDIVEWYSQGPAKQKILNCRSRMVEQYKNDVLASPSFADMKVSEVNELMKDEAALCKMISCLPEYKNRVQREKDAL